MYLSKIMQIFGTFGAFGAGLGVVLGAFAAHGLKAKISPEQLAIFDTGVRYQMIHSLALILVVCLQGRLDEFWLKGAGFGFILGTLIFSGSLYLLVFTHTKTWGAVTPIGGIFFILAWAALFMGFVRTSSL